MAAYTKDSPIVKRTNSLVWACYSALVFKLAGYEVTVRKGAGQSAHTIMEQLKKASQAKRQKSSR